MQESLEQTPVYHIPALLEECMEGLDIKPDGKYIDVTFGGGGHSREILRRLGSNGHLYSFDQDEDAQRNIIDDERFTFVYSNFRYLKNFMHYHEVEAVDGVLADLGVSFHHFDDEERGFSFRFDAPLDMRMNKQARLTAAEILATYSEERLAQLFSLYGELRSARRIAAAIVAARSKGGVKTTGELLELVSPFINRKQEKKELAQLFQALRIEVNNEMDSLRAMLRQAVEMLKPGGRLVVITYHSLEDRIVKNFIKTGNVEGVVEKDFFGRVKTPLCAVNNKVIVPSDEEVERNPRSRSAKLRIAEKGAEE
ncbi:MAG: 16S rRNA (cytosine(1402)-N(4))-methyltransferase RsmH [Bacteroidaceae bacterium]|nr:16S rRNA (cytosine(1402)-N(4))-methyltransferase RsmH [Bacteroidaceae bacterium]